MNYKRIIKSRELRILIMRMLSFIPDKIIVSLQYRIKFGRTLNLDNPQRYTEKLQWYKLNYRDPLMQKCVDKHLVREYVKEKGYGHILNELIGVYDDPDEIDFESLPNQFVIKDTLGGGGNSVILCKNKDLLNVEEIRAQLKKWIRPTKGKHPGREWVYDNGHNRIIIEKYIESDPENGGLVDYKFFCFHGKVAYVYGIADRDLGKGAGLGVFTRNFEQLPYQRADERPLKRVLMKPDNYEELITCAETLAADFPHARIDLYNPDEKILFGEVTFFDGSGYMSFNPDEFDYIMGREFVLPDRNGEK